MRPTFTADHRAAGKRIVEQYLSSRSQPVSTCTSGKSCQKSFSPNIDFRHIFVRVDIPPAPAFPSLWNDVSSSWWHRWSWFLQIWKVFVCLQEERGERERRWGKGRGWRRRRKVGKLKQGERRKFQPGEVNYRGVEVKWIEKIRGEGVAQDRGEVESSCRVSRHRNSFLPICRQQWES